MKLVFAGTPQVAVPSLLALAPAHEIAAVITRVDAPQGRKRVLAPSPVADAAEQLGLPVIKANRLDDTVTSEVAALEADLGVIVAYGGLVKEPLLGTPRLGWINLHFSLLPRWRGAAPVQWSVIAGDTETGAAVFQLVPALDAGDVWAMSSTPIGANETSGNLLERLSHSGARLLADTVAGIGAGTLNARPQSGEVTLAPKLGIDDARLDFGEPVEVVYRRLRGVSPEPGAFTEIEGARLKVLDAVPARDRARLDPGVLLADAGRVYVGTGSAPLELLSVHPAGKKAMPAADWWRGAGVERMTAR